ncbi:protein FAM228B isoform X3 [Parus major]|uniref:protein FAM228B isoform X3 n=1 Tax=Parus major TaxID=9157 RepID=UPI001444625D|nr:protein FAM228B isoform X3 [Parus major]
MLKLLKGQAGKQVVGSGKREEQKKEGLENRCLGTVSNQEVDRYLRHCDFLDLRKTELLYKKYLEDVSEPFMQKMKDQMHSQSEEEVQKRRQEQFSQYLNYCAKKGYVFLDHYDPSEYDPFFQKTCRDCWKDDSHQPAQ